MAFLFMCFSSLLWREPAENGSVVKPREIKQQRFSTLRLAGFSPVRDDHVHNGVNFKKFSLLVSYGCHTTGEIVGVYQGFIRF